MKCEENGGCPFDVFVQQEYGTPTKPPGCALDFKSFDDCHLTSDSFPLIQAMLTGEIPKDHLRMIEAIASCQEGVEWALAYSRDGEYWRHAFYYHARQPQQEGVSDE